MEADILPLDVDPWEQWLSGAPPTPGANDPGAPSQSPEDHAPIDPVSKSSDNADANGLSTVGIDNELDVPSADQVADLLSQLDAISQSVSELGVPSELARSHIEADQSDAESSEGASEDEESAPYAPWLNNERSSHGNGEDLQSIDPELRQAFLDDATECMASIEAAVMQLESDSKNSNALAQIARDLHTLKGASASVGLSELADRLHALEEQLRQDKSKEQVTSVDHLLEQLDWLKQKLDAVRIGRHDASQVASVEPSDDCESTLEFSSAVQPPCDASNAFAQSSVPSIATERLIIDAGADDDESVRVKTSQLNRLMDMLAELVMLRNRRQTEITNLREIYHELVGSVSKLRILSTANRQSSNENDSLQIAEVAADVLEIAQHVRDCTRPVDEGNHAISRFIRQFRQELVELCRAPVTVLFQRLQRAVRDTAKAEGKSVHFETKGANTAIERSLQQRLYEPLLHIVRNSVCHGIEAEEDRTRAGKDATGNITIEAFSGADLLVIEVCDDGGGLNYQAIRSRAIQHGLISPSQSLTERELSQLIFQPGFSTRETVDRQAGRGVGMDVVAATLERLGGWIDVESTAGQGTTIRLSVPLPSAIEHLMVFRCGEQYFATSLLSVQSAGAADANAPSVRLADLLTKSQSTQTAIAVWNPNQPAESPSLVIEYDPAWHVFGDGSNVVSRNAKDAVGPERINLLVDEIIGPEEVVVRPLPSLIRQHPYCSGATISSTGQTTLVLDYRHLLSGVRVQDAVPASEAKASKIAGDKPSFSTKNHPAGHPHSKQMAADASPLVLVVDDSISSRKLVVRGLQKYSLRIVEASDGRQALQLLKTHRFAAVFSDLEMPHIDGLELLSEVRSRDDLRDTPFTIISSRTEDEFTSRANELGVVRYIEKPITDEALAATLSAIESLSSFVFDRPQKG